MKSLITLLEMPKKDTYPINMSSLINKNSKWITKGIMKSIKFKDRLYKQLRSSPPDSPEFHAI